MCYNNFMKTIVLTGMSGSGKSTVAKYLSEKFALETFDIDELIVKKENKSINEIFAQNGEKYFRNLEAQIIQDIFQPEDILISLGGGAFENEHTKNFLLQNSIVIYLKTSPKNIFERLKTATDRPLLNNNMNLNNIENILNSRMKNYELAHFSIITDNKNVEQIGSEITKCANLK